MIKKAFSLAEMMVVMMLLSIVLSASMPIITKRTSGSGGGGGDLWQNANSNDIYYGDTSGTKRVFIGTNSTPILDGILTLNTKGITQDQIIFEQAGTKYGQLIVDGQGNVGLGNVTVPTAGGTTFATAMGWAASATGAGSVAIGCDSAGSGASTTAANTIQLGTANHNVNIPGSQTVGKTISSSGSITATGDVTSNSWLSPYGGGWFMQDSTWIRAYNNKNVYTAGTMEAGALQSDGTLSVAGASTFGGAATYNSSVTYNGNINTPANVNCNNMNVASTFTAANLSTPGAVYASNWLRTYGSTGWYNESYQGGWYMSDPSWVRSYADKSVYTGGQIQAGSIQCNGTSQFAGNMTIGVNGSAVYHYSKDGSYYTYGPGSANLTVNGSVTSFSDRRLKHLKGPFTKGIEKLRQIKPYNYILIGDKNMYIRTGVIAQDLQKIFPNSVLKHESGFLTVAQDEMFYAMINSIKELDASVQWLLQNVKLINSKLLAITKNEQSANKSISAIEATNKLQEMKIKLLESKIKQLENHISLLEKK